MKSITHRRLIPQAGPNFYPTPVWATHALLAAESFRGQIYEPACGRGAISEVLQSAGHRVLSSDLHDWGYGIPHIDYLQQRVTAANVITNPPYSIANAFVAHAVAYSRCKVAMLLRLAFLEGSGRWHKIYSVAPPQRVHVFASRLTMYADGAEVSGSGTTAYAWFVWDHRCHDRNTHLHWIPPR